MKSQKKNKRKPARTASQKFDRELFTVKLSERSHLMQTKSVAAEREACTESRELGDPFSLKMQNVVDGQLVVLREWLEGVDRICREVWQIQGEAVTPDFVRDVLVPEAMKLIAAREATVKLTVAGFASLRTGATKDPSPALRHLAMEVNRLQAEVANRYEIESRELEYKKKQIGVSQHPRTDENQAQSSRVQNNAKSTQDVESKSIKAAAGANWFDSDPDTVRRRQIVLKNPKMPSKNLCAVFDGAAPPIPLPRDWSAELDVSTWSEGYKNVIGRKRIQKIISTDRKTEPSSSS